MRTCLLAVVAAELLGGAARAEGDSLLNKALGKAKEIGSMVGKVAAVDARTAERLRARLLGSFIRKGMTRERVDLILGTKSAVFIYSSDGEAVIEFCYCGGPCVYFDGDGNGVLRVVRVAFEPIFK
jgi:hypothetical protein